ncbi:hypothetical protein V6N13_098689 [Hibiscus sabdariffa]
MIIGSPDWVSSLIELINLIDIRYCVFPLLIWLIIMESRSGQHLLPTDALLCIVALKEPNPNFPHDRIGWALSSNNLFIVKSAYEHRARLTNGVKDHIWSLIHNYRDVNHIFRFCGPTLSTWSLLIQPSRIADFLNTLFRHWLEENLSPKSVFGQDNECWDIMFSSVLWNLWIQRNAAVFGNLVEEWGSLITRSRWLTDTTR